MSSSVEPTERKTAKKAAAQPASSQPVPGPVAEGEVGEAPAVTVRKGEKAGRGRGATTPPHPGAFPAAGPEGQWNLEAPELYLNRELTWLNFNFRVLHEAADHRTPVLERIKFIAIVGSNLDEFFMKRIGGLKQQVGAGVQKRTVDGRTPEQQITECYDLVRELESRQRKVLRGVLDELAQRGIVLKTYGEVGEKDQAYLREFYLENIFPLVTPQATDPAHPFPFISNLSLNLLVAVRNPKEDTLSYARVKVPTGAGVSRFVKLPNTSTFVTLESVMAGNLDLLFPDMEIESCEEFRVTRNANTLLDEETADDLLALIESGLRERRFAPVVRLEVDESISLLHRGRLAAELGLDEEADVFETGGLLALRDLMELTAIRDPELHDPPFEPVDHPLMLEQGNLFHLLRDSDPILLYHPYESFRTSVERFLKEASRDPKVRAIKMVLYRTSAESKIVDYLMEAARNDKQVAVAVELKARFDEEANIRWANRLEEVGVHVTYGVMGLKTHCKAILVVRQDYDGIRRYAHLGTGNYHAETARLYSDLGYLTCDEKIGQDLTELFNYLTTGYKPKRKYAKLLPAPKLLKPALLEKIEREIQKHSEDRPGCVQLKLNALEDAEVTNALYRASQAGVKVDLVVRDSCRLRPGIPGLSDNVRVISIVGRFLEHSRIFYFQNGGEPEYYIGSADCMKRNLEHRVEVLVPIEDPKLREELRFLLDTQINDSRSAWEMQPDGSYVQRVVQDEDVPGSQQVFLDWAQKRYRQASRLRRRKPQVLTHARNLR